jgi:RNA polymerase sigma-70 factor, ECF subfamily
VEGRLAESVQAAVTRDAEAELIEDCKRGDLLAFQQLYTAHGARMKSIALNILGNVHDAEDAVQDAFLNIYRNVGKFRGKSAFSTWTYRILVNACWDQLRARRRRSPEVQAQTDEKKTEEVTTEPLDHPLTVALERSLEKLSERRRTVFLLCEVEGFKHREVSEILGIPEGTSKTLLYEAKRELQRLLWEPSGRRVRSPHDNL